MRVIILSVLIALTTARSALAQCPADINHDNIVDGIDLAMILGSWNSADWQTDLDGNGLVDGLDLAIVLGSWGSCPVGSVFVGVRMEGSATVAFIQASSGPELVAVAFDPNTGVENFLTQRVVGLTTNQLTALANIGDPSLLESLAAANAASLWQLGIPSAGLSPLEVAILSRQSELLFVFRDVTLVDARATDAPSGCACSTNGCTATPNFWFVDACNSHDICYCLSGDAQNRLACDQALRDTIISTGPPIIGPILAELYFAGVQAFGSGFFVQGPRLGACCAIGCGCALLSEKECIEQGGRFYANSACVNGIPEACPNEYYCGCPSYYGIASVFGEQSDLLTYASLSLLLGISVSAVVVRGRDASHS